MNINTLKFLTAFLKFSVLLSLFLIASLPLLAQKLSKKHKGGYVVSWNNDTTEVYIKAKDGCALSSKVEALMMDTQEKVTFYPANIKAFGYEDIDFRLVKNQKTMMKEVDPVDRNLNDPEAMQSLEFAQLITEGQVKAYVGFYEAWQYVSAGMYGGGATKVCTYRLYLNENSAFYEIHDSPKSIKARLKELFRRDPICLSMINKPNLTIEDLMDVLPRYNFHLQGIELEDEKEIREKLKDKLDYFEKTSAINDLVYSSLVELETPDGQILCRRTDVEGAKSLIKISAEVYGNFKQVENQLLRLMKSYIADSLNEDLRPYLDRIGKGIEFLKTRTPTLDVSYYSNELMFYRSVMDARKEE